MNPRLDATIDRREAMSALLVMLAAVMGFGALPEPVEAQEPVRLDARLNGVFLGYSNREQSGARLHLYIEDDGVWARVSRLGAPDSEPAPVLTSRAPEVVRFVSELIGLFPVEQHENADTK